MSLTTRATVLKKYPRPVLAMRAAKRNNMLGLILGAGTSKGFKLPMWEDLLANLAADPRVSGKAVYDPKQNVTARAEMLYRHFAAAKSASYGTSAMDPRALDRRIRGEWFEVIRELLYANLPPPDGKFHRAHPYLSEFLEIIIQSPLTVTYNFDSCIEMMLDDYQKAMARTERLYEVIFDTYTPYQRHNGVIYHPNGFLPANKLEAFSDSIVFSEEQFGDQLLDSVAGRYSSLAHHLSKHTCLLLGVSLNDETLRHLLHANARMSPGHYHYCVEYLSAPDAMTNEAKASLSEYRFDIYNLITLFLTEPEIKALGQLLTCDLEALRNDAGRARIPLVWVYYITGIPGTGKTTVCRHLGDLITLGEWLEAPLDLLSTDYTSLTSPEREKVDAWVANQFVEKNMALLSVPEGVIVVDRCPLDPLAFVDTPDRPAKASAYGPQFQRGQSDRHPVAGSVLILTADPVEVSARLERRQGERKDPKYLEKLQVNHLDIYKAPRVVLMDTRALTLDQQIRSIARYIHREKYAEVDISARLTELTH